MRWLRLVPVVLLGVLAIAYVLMRPALQQSVPHLDVLEFPVGALVVATLIALALARRRPKQLAEPWRRHEQVVRPLPDPALLPYRDALARWVETGEGADDAAAVLARARATDPREQERLRADILPHLTVKASRRKRESLLKQHIEGA